MDVLFDRSAAVHIAPYTQISQSPDLPLPHGLPPPETMV